MSLLIRDGEGIELACGDVISKYENALVYDVSLPAVKPGEANEWVFA